MNCGSCGVLAVHTEFSMCAHVHVRAQWVATGMNAMLQSELQCRSMLGVRVLKQCLVQHTP